MKKSILTKIVIGVIIIGGLLIVASSVAGSTANLRSDAKNGVKAYSSAEKLASSVSYKITVPQFILDEKGLAFTKYQGNFIEMKNDRVRLCAAPYLNNEVSAVGNYNDFTIDERYNVDKNKYNIVYLRYRTDGNNTVVDYFTDSVMYGIELKNFDGINGKEALIHSIGLEMASLENVTMEDGGNNYEEDD